MQLFTLSHFFWLPLVFQGHKIYLLLTGDNFSSIYLIIPKGFLSSSHMLIVYSGLHTSRRWGSKASASSRNVVSSRNKRLRFLAWGEAGGILDLLCRSSFNMRHTVKQGRAVGWGTAWSSAQAPRTRPKCSPTHPPLSGFFSSAASFLWAVLKILCHPLWAFAVLLQCPVIDLFILLKVSFCWCCCYQSWFKLA